MALDRCSILPSIQVYQEFSRWVLMEKFRAPFVYQLAATIALARSIFSYTVYKLKKARTCLHDIKQ